MLENPVSGPVDPRLLEEAMALGVDVDGKPAHKRERWRVENRRAIEAWNRWVEVNGIPFDDLRPW
ncbi:MAG: type II toxin-antitoxin system CcdA family antitoxin [Rhizobiales bacterium]|nr:type II toxin-antitoxin system CcdA family antitoxin [Hyphomicrobiales bacterium]